MFYVDYVPLVEQERLTQEYLSLKQTSDSVTEITEMFMERALCYPENVASEQAQMLQYLSILKIYI